jgi:outer membrane protein OmpA-like peptidoglycan-associated protein
MKKSFALMACMTLIGTSQIGTQAQAAGIGGIPNLDENDGPFSLGAGYYYQRSDFEGINGALAEDALSDIVRDAPYLRASYHFTPDWTLSGIYGYENVSNDPRTAELELESGLRDTFFGAQLTGRLYQSDAFDIGAFVQYTNHSDYDISGRVATTAYNIQVDGLSDILAGAMVQKSFRSFDLYGGAFYQDTSADVSGTAAFQPVSDTLEVDASGGGMLGAIFHVHDQWDINVEYQNRGDHGVDISATYHFLKPQPKVITKIVEVPVEVPVVTPDSFEGVIHFPAESADIQADQRMVFRKLALFLEQNPEATAYVEGHCDCIGTEEDNQTLSEQRAEAVKVYLMDYYAIDADRISTRGFGELQPIDTNDTEEGRQNNRRVRVYAEREADSSN